MSKQGEVSLPEKNENRLDNVFAVYENLKERLEEMEEVGQVTERITHLEQKVENLSDKTRHDDKNSRVEAILYAAKNKADPGMDAVLMSAKDIKIATGLSTSQSYRYIEDLPEDFGYISAREDDSKERGVIVDLSHVETERSDSHA
jgi:pimeloyl-CoA synthetase